MAESLGAGRGWRLRLLKFLAYALCLPFAVFGAYALYFWITYQSIEATSGQMYGLAIGDTKHQAYEKIPEAFRRMAPSADRIYIHVQADDYSARTLAAAPGANVFVETPLDPVGYASFASQDLWVFYVEPSFWNSLTLTFCEQKLCRIYRHRQAFEVLP